MKEAGEAFMSTLKRMNMSSIATAMNGYIACTHTYSTYIHTYIHNVYSYSWFRSVIESNDPIAPVNEKGKNSRIFFLSAVCTVCMYVCMYV